MPDLPSMWLSLSAAFFAVVVAIHALLCHGVRAGGPLIKFVVTGGIAGLILILLAARGPLDVRGASAVLVYMLACELYIFLFTMVSSSISVSILLTLSTRRTLAEEDLASIYSARGMVERRLERLVASGLLARSEGAYRATPKGLRLIILFRGLRRFFAHEGAPVVERAADSKETE